MGYGHMRYPGTITVPESVFEGVLEAAARSFAVHGFRDIVFLGDSGGNQEGMKQVPARLNAKWKDRPSRVHFIREYYDYGGVARWLEQQGIKQKPEGLHDDFVMTAQMMAVDPTTVHRPDWQKQVAGDAFNAAAQPASSAA